MRDKIKVYTNWLENHRLALSILIGICFIVVALSLGRYSNFTIPGNNGPNARYMQEPGTHLDFMAEWDSLHYIHIAQHGYTNSSLAAFFPLYPLMIRLAMFVFGSPLISALLISWLALIGAVYYYLRILTEFFKNDSTKAVMGVLLFLFFPTGIFLAAAYSEGLFALLSLAAIYYAFRRQYIVSGVLTGLATLSRPDGVFILLLIAAMLYELRAKLWQIGLSVLLGCSGIISYMIFLGIKLHNPLAFISAQKHHIRWLSDSFFHSFSNTLSAVSLILFVLAIIAVIYWWRRRRSFALFGLLFVLLPILTANFNGYPRYLLIDFPLQLMLLDKFKKSSPGYALILMISAIAWAYFTIHYAAGYTGGS